MWIFTYGLEMWKANFPHLQRIPGCITGYSRRLWIKNEDKYGDAEEPGRIVTLIKTDSPNDMVWGAAYEISAENEGAVIEQIDFRDKPNFTNNTVTFYPVPPCTLKEIDTVAPFEVTVYCPTDDNNLFMKDELLKDTAISIAISEGSDGSNSDYLFRLATEMRNIAPHYFDKHVFTLEALVQHIHTITATLEDD